MLTIKTSYRILNIILAGGLMGIALSLIAGAGLPQRADFTGQTITNLGYVAPEPGKMAPPFTALNTEQEGISLLDLRGETVIINFWATWCIPCQVEMPELQHVFEQFHESQGLHVLGINLGEDLQTVVGWGQDMGLSFDLLLDPNGQIASLYQLRGQPMTYIINPDGIITHIFFGPTNAESIYAQLPFETEPG